MKVNFVVVHELIKEVNISSAAVDLSSALLELDDNSLGLVNELNKRYTKLSVTYGNFNKIEPSVFQQEFCHFMDNQSDISFLHFSKNTMHSLKDIVKRNAPAKGGYLVYADYEDFGNFIGVFLIRNTNGKLFQKDAATSMFKINSSLHIDFEKMAMACRINKDIHLDNERRPLSFIKRGNDDISQYFLDWISTTDKEDNSTDTIYLNKMVNTISPPIDSSGNIMERENFKEKIYNYVKSTPGKNVDLKVLGVAFYNNESHFIDYAQMQNLPISTEFKANTQLLKKMINIKVKADYITLDFPEKLFNDKIRIDENDPDHIIINSFALAEKIRRELQNND